MVLAFGNLHKTFITSVNLHNRLKGVALMWASKSMRENIIVQFFEVWKVGLGNEEFVLRNEEPDD